MLRLLLCAATLRVVSANDPCGCSWSSQNGCGISGAEFVSTLTQLVNVKVCTEGDLQDDRSKMECGIRQHVKAAAERASICLGFNAQQCMHAAVTGSALCQWGAQGANQCGIDEEKLLVSLVGEPLMQHPLMQAVILHDKCSELGEQFCEANPDCSWLVTRASTALCDMNPRSFFRALIDKPVILQLTQFSMSGAICRAEYEHGNPPSCRSPCILEAGICRLDISQAKAPNMFELMEVVCTTAQEDCPSPCKRMMGKCHRPAMLPQSYDPQYMRLTNEDMIVAQVFMVLQSATLMYEQQCNLRHSRDMCFAASKTCDDQQIPHVTPASRQPGRTAPALPAAPGMKGALGKLLGAVTGGMASRNLSQFLLQHPDEVMKVTQKLGVPKVGELMEKHPAGAVAAAAAAGKIAQGIESILKRAPSPVPIPPSPRAVPAPAPAILIDSVPSSTGTRHSKDLAEAAELPAAWYTNPWAVAAGTTLSAAICAGIAMGALCHAQMVRSARDPLLMEEVMQDYEVAPLGQNS